MTSRSAFSSAAFATSTSAGVPISSRRVAVATRWRLARRPIVSSVTASTPDLRAGRMLSRGGGNWLLSSTWISAIRPPSWSRHRRGRLQQPVIETGRLRVRVRRIDRRQDERALRKALVLHEPDRTGALADQLPVRVGEKPPRERACDDGTPPRPDPVCSARTWRTIACAGGKSQTTSQSTLRPRARSGRASLSSCSRRCFAAMRSIARGSDGIGSGNGNGVENA